MRGLSLLLSCDVTNGQGNLFNGSAIATHPLGSATRDRLARARARRGSGVRLSVRPSFCHQCVARSHCFPYPGCFSVLLGYLFFSLSLSRSLVSPRAFLSLRPCLSSSFYLLSPRSPFPSLSYFMPLLVFFLSLFSSPYAHPAPASLLPTASSLLYPAARKSQVRRYPNRGSWKDAPQNSGDCVSLSLSLSGRLSSSMCESARRPKTTTTRTRGANHEMARALRSG